MPRLSQSMLDRLVADMWESRFETAARLFTAPLPCYDPDSLKIVDTRPDVARAIAQILTTGRLMGVSRLSATMLRTIDAGNGRYSVDTVFEHPGVKVPGLAHRTMVTFYCIDTPHEDGIIRMVDMTDPFLPLERLMTDHTGTSNN